MKYYFSFLVISLLLACNPSPQRETSNQLSNSNDPCAKYAETLNGAFAVSYMEGTMVWKGGLTGSVDIAGNDYNDMTCTYTVADCVEGIVTMRCNEYNYDATMIIYTRDSLRLDANTYTRIR